MSDYRFVSSSSENEYGNANEPHFNECIQQRFGFQNPQQTFSVESISPFTRQHSTRQHSTENMPPQSQHSLPWDYSRDSSNPNVIHRQNIPFVTPNSQANLCSDNAFHFNGGQDAKPFLPPPPVPPPLLPLGKDSRPPFPQPLCPPHLLTCSAPQGFGPTMFPAASFRQPSPNSLDSQNQQFEQFGLDVETGESQHVSSINQPSSSTVLSLNSYKKDEDQEWMCHWVAKLREKLDQRKGKTTSLKISDIQKKLLKYASLICELEELLKQFCCESEDHNLDILYEKSEHIKHEISLLRSFFGEEGNGQIKEMLALRRERRLKTRRLKKNKADRRRKLKEKWNEKERKINQQLKQIYEEEKTKIIEEKVKKEADVILREVRTKQDEVHKMQKLLEALSQLRDARIKKGEVHGYVTCPRANSFFSKAQDEFRKLIPNQLDLYHGEEQTLRVMMEESKTTFTHSSSKVLNARFPNDYKLEKLMYEILFGSKIPRERCDEFQRSFTAAEESVEILINRRHDWDQFLVDADSVMGSSVPVGWVIPNVEANPDWKTFQQD